MDHSPALLQELPYHKDSAALFAPWAEQPWAVFLDSGHPHAEQGRYDILAAEPWKILVTWGDRTEISCADECVVSLDDPFMLLKQALGEQTPSRALPFEGGAIGYFGYDLARRLEQLPQQAIDAERIPDMVIGIYDWALVVDHSERCSWLVGQGRDPETRRKWPQLLERFSRIAPASTAKPFQVIGGVTANMSAEDYSRAFSRIKHYLREGDCYQVNLAQRFSARCEGSLWQAYRVLRRENAAPFSAYLNFPQVQILSSSPERFLRAREGRVETKPIKGTRRLQANPWEDMEQIRALKQSGKDRAENLMIVDLLRNDLGKSCKPGSVHVPKLFDVETFATVHHLVSTVRGELDAGHHALDLLRGCFPGGSITGAPKIRAMQIIEELEPHRRGAYCGSLAYIGFNGNMDSNIAIRTLVHSDDTIRFWAGGGIVSDSDAEQEYQECFDKAAAMLRLLRNMAAGSDSDSVGG